MKIAMLVSSVSRQAGGLFHSVRGLSRELRRQRTEVEVFTLEDEHTRADAPAWEGIRIHAFRAMCRRPFPRSEQLVRSLIAAAPDVVHTHGLWEFTSLACMRWARATGRPYVAAPHGMLEPWALRRSRWKKCLAWWFFERQHLRNASCLHALNREECSSIRTVGLENTIAVIPNGIDMPSPRIDVARDHALRNMLFLGRIHPKKGLDVLLRAWAGIHNASPSTSDRWHLTIAGWGHGDYERHMRGLSHSLGLDECVTFRGPVFGVDKEALYRSADAFILPSFSEGLPMAVLEAWSYGLPVIVTPECHLDCGIRAGAAVSVDPTVNSLVTAISRLIGMSASERLAMGARGCELVRRDFEWSGIARHMRCVYEWVAGGGPAPDCVTVKGTTAR